MAEASMVAYGAVIGVAITLATVLFALRGKGHPELLEWNWWMHMEFYECTCECGCKRIGNDYVCDVCKARLCKVIIPDSKLFYKLEC